LWGGGNPGRERHARRRCRLRRAPSPGQGRGRLPRLARAHGEGRRPGAKGQQAAGFGDRGPGGGGGSVDGMTGSVAREGSPHVKALRRVVPSLAEPGAGTAEEEDAAVGTARRHAEGRGAT